MSGVMEILVASGKNLQNGEFAGFQRQHREEKKAKKEANGGTKVACHKYEHPIPSTYCISLVLFHCHEFSSFYLMQVQSASGGLGSIT